MAANAPVTKPSVLWLALLILVGGALVLIAGLTLLTLGSITLPQGAGIKQTLTRAIPYIGVVLGTVDIVAGVSSSISVSAYTSLVPLLAWLCCYWFTTLSPKMPP